MLQACHVRVSCMRILTLRQVCMALRLRVVGGQGGWLIRAVLAAA
jgi:hypothetical protein